MAPRVLVAMVLAIAAFADALLSFASSRPVRSHLYILLGFANNSPGLDEFGTRMAQRGIHTTVSSYIAEPILAQQAINEYQHGNLRSILIVGHSYGGRAALEMAEDLARSHVRFD